MNIYKDLFTNVAYANTREEKLAFVNHFVRELRKRGPHCELVFDAGKCALLQAILTKFNFKFDYIELTTRNCRSVIAIFEINGKN